MGGGDVSESVNYPATGIRALIATWLRSPLERAYLEGYQRAVKEHQPIIKEYERALRQERRR